MILVVEDDDTVRPLVQLFLEYAGFSVLVASDGDSGWDAFTEIFVVPANHEADEIAAAKLAQLLTEAGYAALPLPVDFARQEKLGIVDPLENDLFCISAVPPFAFAGAITLVRQLKLRFPRTRVMAGVWGFSGKRSRLYGASNNRSPIVW